MPIPFTSLLGCDHNQLELTASVARQLLVKEGAASADRLWRIIRVCRRLQERLRAAREKQERQARSQADSAQRIANIRRA
jgi:hypothetical protein